MGPRARESTTFFKKTMTTCKITLWSLLALAAGLGGGVVLRAQESGGQASPVPPPPPPTVAVSPQAFPPPPAPGAFQAYEGPDPYAFPREDACGTRGEFYFGVGTQALQRQRLHSTPISVLDPGTTTTTTQQTTVPVTGTDGNTSTGDFPPMSNPRTVNVPATANVSTTTFSRTGNPPPPGAPPFGNYNNALPGMNWGLVGTVGYRAGDMAVEATGFYILRRENSAAIASSSLSPSNPGTVTLVSFSQADAQRLLDTDKDGDAIITSVGSPNASAAGNAANVSRLDLPFFNPPPGFAGMFLQADHVNLTFDTTLASAEVNFRKFCIAPWWDALIGFRYLNVRENFSEFVSDDPVPTPTGTVVYQTSAHNNLLAPQLGLVFSKELLPSFTISATFKGAWGVNVSDSSVLLERGDGLIGFSTRQNHAAFGHMYEIGVMADWAVNCSIHLRAGYTVLWALNMAEAAQQVDFDLSRTTGTGEHNGTIFYQGPTLELLFSF